MEVSDDEFSTYMAILLKNHVISSEVSMWMNYEALSDNYGWLPDEIDRQDPRAIDIYMAILSGKAKRHQVSTKQTKRMK